METPFLGPAYVARSTNLADNRLINLYPEIVETRQGKTVGAFFMTPGLDLYVTLGAGPIYGALPMNGKLYVVSSTGVYRVTAAGAVTLLGLIPTAVAPVAMITNGTEMAVIDGTAATLITESTGAISTIALPFSNPIAASYQDGFGLIVEGGSQHVWSSALRNLNSWSATAFGNADSTPNNVTAIATVRREQWVFKTDSTEVWANYGLNNFPFQRIDGVFIETGCAAPLSVALLGESLIWLTQNRQGQAQVVHASGYNPVVVSTAALDHEFQSYGDVSNAFAYTHQMDGHLFYVLTFPDNNTTWVYDATASKQLGFPCWHQRASFVGGQLNRHWGNCFTFFDGKQLIGDYASGNLYVYNLQQPLDNGSPRKWVRSWRALQKPVRVPVSFTDLQIDMQTGAGMTPGADPVGVLRWSDDGGHVWSNERLSQLGGVGKYGKRIKFNRLGSTRRGSGLDRIFELSSTDPFFVTLMGAELA